MRVKSAPALEESFETTATKFTVAPVNMEAGGASLKPMEIGGVGVTWMVVATVLVGSALDAPVIVTVPFTGTFCSSKFMGAK